MRWILAQDLDRWADTQIGRAEIARLVGMAICATARTVHSFRFPSGDSAQIPGFDGHLIADGVPPFVPDGESVWEFGAGQDYLDKADEEYQKRTRLQTWIVAARRAAAESGRARAADQFIGEALARAPLDPDDKAWPHRIVRDVIESVGSEEIERGIQIGRSNMQGAHAIDPKHPAALERHLATQARAWAGTAARWPRTAALLNSMASQWERLAEALEQRARQDAMRD